MFSLAFSPALAPGQAIFENIDFQISLFDNAKLDRHVQIAREQVGKTRFETLAAEGRAMTTEQAIAYALDTNE